MTRGTRIWLAVTVLFILANLAGGIYAALRGEVLHAGVHVALVLLGEWIAWRLVTRARARRLTVGR